MGRLVTRAEILAANDAVIIDSAGESIAGIIVRLHDWSYETTIRVAQNSPQVRESERGRVTDDEALVVNPGACGGGMFDRVIVGRQHLEIRRGVGAICRGKIESNPVLMRVGLAVPGQAGSEDDGRAQRDK